MASLNQGDAGDEIVFGKLDENGYPAKDPPWAVAFTEEKIKRGYEKVSSVYLAPSFAA